MSIRIKRRSCSNDFYFDALLIACFLFASALIGFVLLGFSGCKLAAELKMFVRF